MLPARAMVDGMSHLVGLLSPEGYILDANTAALAFCGLTPAQAIGTLLWELPIWLPQERTPIKRLFRQVVSKKQSRHQELEVRRGDGKHVFIDLTLNVLRDDSGAVRGVVGEAYDITEQRRLAHEAQEANRRLAEAQCVAQIGSWEFELATGKITWSDQTFRLFGFDPAAGPPDYAAHLARHHPDDQPLLAAAVQRAMVEGIPYDLSLRVVLDDGRQRWVHCLGRAVRDKTGAIINLVGTSQDITAWKATEQEQLRRERVLTEVLDVMPHLAILVDADGFAHYYNGHFFSFTGLDPATPTAEIHWRQLVHPDDIPIYECAVDSLAECTEPYECELRIRRKDGALRWHLMRTVPIFGGEKEVQRFVVTGTDISTHRAQEEALHHTNSRLEVQATVDALTGVFNRYVLEECLPDAWERAQKEGKALSVVLLDVDHFKSYNDTFGHVCGDQVLRQLGTLLRSTIRTDDTVIRYGGEEFMIVLPHTDSASAQRWAERVRSQIESRVWPKRAITASLGIATWSGTSSPSGDTTEGLSGLIALTDSALYQAKVHRNSVAVAHYGAGG
ncbi:sensor domain-containing diguanylate cyclase [Armatimonas rosea]|uniref:Diguanylate cyclase (GGDEF)-like protein/PAS domain S-box-containing protein n=1 Tax=Armatimonas rosea TaxID=685828 RepID=A0A7W9SQK3_ARMRO|nr:diguanylate cyclase [Armatimonas rosea]MBB6051012.1 diguanylate cyclase (GGDEF)-like protein/PAS domain S-box-containing protein [Armatimonas rosea]